MAIIVSNPDADTDPDIAAIAALTPADGTVIVGNGTTWVAESGATARASLGLGSSDAVTHLHVYADTASFSAKPDERTVIGTSAATLFGTGSDAEMTHHHGRIFVGDAAGKSDVESSPATKSWPGNVEDGYMTYHQTRYQISVAPLDGLGAVAGATRSSTNDRVGQLGFPALNGFGYNDNTDAGNKKSVWALYGHAYQAVANQFTTAMELDTATEVAGTDVDPYSMGVTGTVAGAWIGVGGETAQGKYANGSGGDLQPISCMVGIVNTEALAPGNYAKKGIVFQENVVDADANGNKILVEMPDDGAIQWKYSGGANARSGLIVARGAAAAMQSRIVFNDAFMIRGVEDDLTTELTLFHVVVPAQSGTGVINGLRLSPQQTTAGATGLVILLPETAATNCNFELRGKGSGAAKLVDGSGNTKIAANTTGVGFYGVTPVARATTGISAGAFVANTSGIADDTATFGGYTMGQVVAALKAIGILT